MKRILVMIGAAIGALALVKKSQSEQAERALWAEATDDVNN